MDFSSEQRGRGFSRDQRARRPAMSLCAHRYSSTSTWQDTEAAPTAADEQWLNRLDSLPPQWQLFVNVQRRMQKEGCGIFFVHLDYPCRRTYTPSLQGLSTSILVIRDADHQVPGTRDRSKKLGHKIYMTFLNHHHHHSPS